MASTAFERIGKLGIEAVIQTWTYNNQNCGWKIETNRAIHFFGNKNADRDLLKNIFPNVQFAGLKQIHSNVVVSADPNNNAEADGHITDQKNIALLIQTADCIPILMSSDHQVAALHAGWRGVAQNISYQSTAFWRSQPQFAAIGPHIQRQSFEIGLEVVEQLKVVHPDPAAFARFVFPHDDPQKRYFDLGGLVEWQLRTAFPQIQVIRFTEDTFDHPLLHSYRRHEGTKSRQYSFVMMKD